MRVGDLIKFKGSWSNPLDERHSGLVMQVWTNGRTRKQQFVDILWDNGDFSKQFGVHHVEVVNESS